MAVLTDELNLPRDTTVDEIVKDATLQNTNTALAALAKDTTLSAINTALDALAKDTSVQGITTAMSAINTALAALASLAKDTTLQATNTALGSLAKDTSLQAVNTALGSLATDLTLGATNTALGNVITQLQAIATAISQSGGSSDYEQLSNRPQINSTVLSGNKTGSALGLSDAADISGLVLSGTTNTTGQSIASGTYFYLNGDLVKAIATIANGATFTLNTNYEIVTVGSELSTLNSALLSDTGWVRTDPTSATNTTMYRKKGYTVTVLIQVNGAVADGTVLGTLPAECRPPRAVYVRNYNIASVATQNFTSIAADGKITKIGGGGEWVNATLTYVV